MGVSDMAGNTFDVGVSFNECLIYLILLFICGLKRDTILDISLFMIGFVFPKMLGLDA